MTAANGADWLLAALAEQGVPVLFGNPGSTELPLTDALGRQDRVRYVLALHEAAAVGMADGYARALLVNAREAELLTGLRDPETAAVALAERAPVAIVTLGAGGAIAAGAEGSVRVPGVAVEAVDTTGAGDLFAAAYVWADHWGVPLEERLRWSVLYASLSVQVATAVAGAVTLGALLEEGAEHGLASPVRQPSAAMKEDAK